MKCFLFLLVFIFLSGFTNCSHVLPYEDDNRAMPSGFYYAGSPEFNILVNGKFCLDSNGKNGLCSFRHKRDKDFITKILPRDYAYFLSIKCNNVLESNIDIDVPKGKEFVHVIPRDKLENIKEVFYCRGNIKRNGIDTNPTMSYLIYGVLVKKDYRFLAESYRKDDAVILGKHALNVQCFRKGKWKRYKKLTVFKEKRSIPCFYETYNGRSGGYELSGYVDKNN